MPTCWVLCDEGKIGTLNQCLGLAESMGLKPIVKTVAARLPWRWLPPVLWPFSLNCIKRSAELSSSWPDIIIAGGRISAIPAATIRLLSQKRTKVIQLLNPHVRPQNFDVIIAPQHDDLDGANILQTLGTFHRVNPQRLNESKQAFQPQLAHLPQPILAVLIGGSNRSYKLNQDVVKQLSDQLRRLSIEHHYSLVISISRRTDPKLMAYLQQQLQDLPMHFWNGQEPNPYFAYLGIADKIIVTCDSISMIAEAASTGKPVYVYPLPGYSKKFARFYQAMKDGNHIRFFSDPLIPFSPQALNDYEMIAPQLLKLIH